jgi:tetratricopeptide (TPR) repeat protein
MRFRSPNQPEELMASLRRIGPVASLFVVALAVVCESPAQEPDAPDTSDSSAVSPADSSEIVEGDPGLVDGPDRRPARGPTDRSVPTTDLTEVPLAEIREAVGRGDWGGALELVRRRGNLIPEGRPASELRILEGRLLDRLDQARGAQSVFTQLLEDPWVSGTARVELHDAYVRRGYFRAADTLTSPPADAPLDPELANLRAYSMSAQGRYGEAARLTEEGARSGDPRAQVLRANALLVLGEQEGAEGLYLAALRETDDPELTQVANFGLGQVARLGGGRALRALQNERAAQLGSAPWAQLDWGLALRALGRRGEARERLEVVAASYPGLASTAHLAMARLEEEEGRAEAAIEHLASALDGSFGDFLVWTRLGDLLIQEGRDEAGIEAYWQALATFPGFPPGAERLTRALAARGRWEEAPETPDSLWQLPGWTWERLLDGDLPFYELATDRDSLDATDPRRVVLALVHERAGYSAAVLGWTDDVHAGTGLLAILRAEALEEVGRTDDALALWEAIAAADPEIGLPEERWARALYASDPIRASEIWAEYFARHPGDAHARIRMAELLESADEVTAARAAFQQARSSGWLSPEERRRLKVRIDDLDDAIRQEQESHVDG